jgi:NitT/TauT family transport system ATP-binding protein
VPIEEPIIEARKVEKFYGERGGTRIQVVAPTDLAIGSGEIVALLGPSGSGKSTLLRILTGLAKPSSGEVLWHGRPLEGPCANVAIVFQSFALFPWLTVLDNVQAPLLARGVPLAERMKRSLRILDAVGLDGFEGAFPKELSGGMKQRVGFARALVVEPEVLFMDEPFSALDVLTAENLRNELLELWEDRKMPTRAVFIVTHNIEEAVTLADRVIVLGKNPGRIRADFKVVVPRPREHKDSRFLHTVDYIYRILTQPDVTPAPSPGIPAAAPAGAPAARPPYPMLPHARPGGIAGILELLVDRGGRDNLHHLADDLAFELDDLLPIVEAASMLGFIVVTEGDAEITTEGREFAEADILQRKELFRKAAQNVPLIRQITRSLEAKADHSLAEEFFYDLLEEHFSDDEIKRQLETAINWSRYAELFDYDSTSERFYIPKDTPEAALPQNVSGH